MYYSSYAAAWDTVGARLSFAAAGVSLLGVTVFVEIKLLSGAWILTLFTKPSVQVVAFQRYLSTSEVPAARAQVGVLMRVVIISPSPSTQVPKAFINLFCLAPLFVRIFAENFVVTHFTASVTRSILLFTTYCKASSIRLNGSLKAFIMISIGIAGTVLASFA